MSTSWTVGNGSNLGASCPHCTTETEIWKAEGEREKVQPFRNHFRPEGWTMGQGKVFTENFMERLINLEQLVDKIPDQKNQEKTFPEKNSGSAFQTKVLVWHQQRTFSPSIFTIIFHPLCLYFFVYIQYPVLLLILIVSKQFSSCFLFTPPTYITFYCLCQLF